MPTGKTERQHREHGRMLRRRDKYGSLYARSKEDASARLRVARRDGAPEQVVAQLQQARDGYTGYQMHLRRQIRRNDPSSKYITDP